MLRAAYGEAVIKKCVLFEYHTMFVEGRKDVKDDGGSGRPVKMILTI